AGGRAVVGVQAGQGVDGFGVVGREVPPTAGVVQVGARVGRERVNHVRELDGIADKEGREVVADKVPVAIGGVELGGEAARIAQGFRGVAVVGHGREAHEHRSGSALVEDLGDGQVGNVGGRGK